MLSILENYISIIENLPFKYVGRRFTTDIHYTCSAIEYIARELMQPNSYVVNALGNSGFEFLMNHSRLNPEYSIYEIYKELCSRYSLTQGRFDITQDKFDLPNEEIIGRVYANLFEDLQLSTLTELYSLPICRILDDYNNGAYLECRKCIANNFTTPNDRYYGDGFYCTEYKPTAVRWAKIYGGRVKRINARLPRNNVTEFFEIRPNYIPPVNEELLIAPLPDADCITFLYDDEDTVKEISLNMPLRSLYIYRNKLPEDDTGYMKLYTVVFD